MAQLSKIISVIRGLTNKIFVPTYICNSPMNPDSEMLILMRVNTDSHIPNFDLAQTNNQDLVLKKFPIIPIQFMRRDIEKRRAQLELDLQT